MPYLPIPYVLEGLLYQYIHILLNDCLVQLYHNQFGLSVTVTQIHNDFYLQPFDYRISCCTKHACIFINIFLQIFRNSFILVKVCSHFKFAQILSNYPLKRLYCSNTATVWRSSHVFALSLVLSVTIQFSICQWSGKPWLFHGWLSLYVCNTSGVEYHSLYSLSLVFLCLFLCRTCQMRSELAGATQMQLLNLLTMTLRETDSERAY